MKKEEIIKYCLQLSETYEDYPFPNDEFSVTIKHISNKKWFALIMNVKDKYIIPAYHMNKEHWNTIIISEEVDESIVKELIQESYELTKKK